MFGCSNIPATLYKQVDLSLDQVFKILLEAWRNLPAVYINITMNKDETSICKMPIYHSERHSLSNILSSSRHLHLFAGGKTLPARS